MKILFVGGGTAGHINPALALAEYTRKKNPKNQILYVGAKGGMEEKLVKKAGFEFSPITISGFSRKMNLSSLKKNITTIKNIIISSFESIKILKDFKPDICIGTGGYVCGPLLREAYRLKIPFLIHDSNSYPGLTTKLLSKKATKVLVSFEDIKNRLPKNIEVVLTGTPVREKILCLDKQAAKQKLGLNENPTILSFGGSLGAKAINDVMAKIITSKENNFNYIHGFGRKGKSFIENIQNSKIDISNPRYIIKEYIENMDECLAAADVVVCRAGATTLSELQASKAPAVLIPSPNVAENHQYYNALSLVNAKAASMIEEKNLTPEILYSEIIKIINSPNRLNYPQNLEKMSIKNSCEIIYKIIEESIKK